MCRWVVAAAATLALCGQALAADTDNENTAAFYGPKYDTLKAGWPRDAQGQLIYGQVKLDCAIGPKAFATDCKVRSSTPANRELEQAALKLAPLYKASDPKAISRAIVDIDVRYDQAAEWRVKPSIDQLLAVWPHEAATRGVSGSAVIKCIVQVNGLTRACTLVKEDTPGLGFGSAAIALSRTFLFKPAIKHGQPVESEIAVPVRWTTDGAFPEESGETRIQHSSEKSKIWNTPVWSKTPTMADILAQIDQKVGDKFAEGQVVFQCRLDKRSGQLNGCVVASASPGMVQFKDVAKALIPKFQVDKSIVSSVKDDLLVDLAFAFPDMSSPEWNKRYLRNPQWLRTISPDPDKATFPEAAAKAGLKTGKATVDCIVAGTGALSKCTVVSESTPNMGFGEMAIQIAQTFAANPWNVDGLPVEGAHARMPIQMDYTPPADPVPAPTPATKP